MPIREPTPYNGGLFVKFEKYIHGRHEGDLPFPYG